MSEPATPPPLTSDADFEAPRISGAAIRSRGELPLLHKEGGTSFVTFRLFDAVRLQEATSIAAPQEPEGIAEASEPPLRSGSCALGRPEAARIVADALRHFDG